MIFVEILYSDLTRQRVPIQEVHSLVRTGVLAIIISAPDDIKPRLNGYRRVAEATGKDFYYIIIQDDRVGIDSRDEFERIQFYQKNDPLGPCGYVMEHPLYAGKNYMFEGKAVPEDKWQEALEIFNKDMH